MGRQLLLMGLVATVGGAGAALGPWPLREVIGDTIAVFAILAAFLIQVMLLLATAFSGGGLSSDRIAQVAQRLGAEQRRASWVFFAYLVLIAAAITMKATMPEKPDGAAIWLLVALHGMTGIGGAAAAYGTIGTVSFVRSLRAVQELRHRLIIEEAEAREAAKRRELLENVSFVAPSIPASNYGKRFGK